MLFSRKRSTPIPPMSEVEFLAVLTAIAVQRRLNPPQKSGYHPMAFSRAFARVGHWDGGPAFIRSDIDGESGPICEACRFLTGKKFPPQQWREAAEAIGLPKSLAREIQNACELSLNRDPALYRRLLIACDLTWGDDDDEDLPAERRLKAV